MGVLGGYNFSSSFYDNNSQETEVWIRLNLTESDVLWNAIYNFSFKWHTVLTNEIVLYAFYQFPLRLLQFQNSFFNCDAIWEEAFPNTKINEHQQRDGWKTELAL